MVCIWVVHSVYGMHFGHEWFDHGAVVVCSSFELLNFSAVLHCAPTIPYFIAIVFMYLQLEKVISFCENSWKQRISHTECSIQH